MPQPATIPQPPAPAISRSEPIRVLCAARYGQLGASSRLRLTQYRPFLEALGIRTTVRAFLSDHYIRALYTQKSRLPAVAAAYMRALAAPLATRRHDVIWIEKEFLPWLPAWLERRVIGPAPYILDFDDAWSLRYAEGSAPVRWLLGGKFGHMLRGAALTVTANETLYAWAKGLGAKNVLLLPTVVDLEHYKVTPEPAGVFTICWVGTPLTAVYLDEIAEPLRQLAAEAPLNLLIIGAPDKNIEGVTCLHAAWSEQTEAALIASSHAGIMPLPDDEWARGKSGYKLIQYMACARPAVASAIGANRQIVAQGVTGYLAKTPSDWLEQLRMLRDHPEVRAKFGAAARLRVAQKYSLQVTAPVLAEAIKQVLLF
jgi:glycosyltransferase involved in cell wall biosynthesis